MSPVSYIGNKDLIMLGEKPRRYKSNLCFSAKVKAKTNQGAVSSATIKLASFTLGFRSGEKTSAGMSDSSLTLPLSVASVLRSGSSAYPDVLSGSAVLD